MTKSEREAAERHFRDLFEEMEKNDDGPAQFAEAVISEIRAGKVPGIILSVP